MILGSVWFPFTFLLFGRSEECREKLLRYLRRRRVPASADKSCWLKNAQEISDMVVSMYEKCTK